MKKLMLLLLLLATAFPGWVRGQTMANGENANGYRIIPGEEVFVHYNTSLLFSGEYLYYKVYSLSEATGLLSGLSKIAYVELLGEDGTQVFKHKIKLNNGTGQGDFFLPTTVPSGNYKLLAYTRWMLNNPQNFFSGDVAIVNPYRGDQRAVSITQEEMTGSRDSLSGIAAEGNRRELNVQSDHVQLDLNRNSFGKKEQVILKLKPISEKGFGNYSVSVRRTEDLDDLPMPLVTNRVKFPENPSVEEEFPQAVYLPELRGELLTGKILPKEGAANPTIQNRKLILSIPGEDYIVKVAGTNERGEFFFNLNGTYSGTRALLELMGEDKEQYSIEIVPGPAVASSGVDFHKFYISPEMEERILERSIHNQIENAYYSVKPDTLLSSELRTPFYESLPVVYELDDFTRFPTVRETFIEIIKEAAVRNNKVLVRHFENAVDYGIPPLLIVDGVVVQNHQDFLDIPAPTIKSISVVRQHYYLGPHMFQGVIDVVTVNQNFWETFTPPHLREYDLEKPRPVKNYFKQSYAVAANEHIPDFRYQLFWQPEVEINREEVALEFYTSEVVGNFEILLQGFTGDGTPVFIRRNFRVE